jgi:hypothetical protein
MTLDTFSKPGDTDVISAEYIRKINVNNISLNATLEAGCWLESNHLVIRVSGKGIHPELFESKISFKRAKLKDINKLIRQIKVASCSVKKCKGHYLKGGKLKFNPDLLCGKHLRKAQHKAIVNASTSQTKKTEIEKRKICKKSKFKIGDWVNAYNAGIFRIEKIMAVYREKNKRDPLFQKERAYKPGELTDRRIILKQFLSTKFKKYLSPHSCSERFLSLLDPRQSAGLKAAIKRNPQWLTALDAYTLPLKTSLTLTHDMRIHIRNRKDLERIENLIKFIKTGKTFSEFRKKVMHLHIQKLIRNETSSNCYLSLFNYSFEFDHKKKEFIWTDAELYNKPKFG